MTHPAAFSPPTFHPGTVWITGAGPGDPGLLTLLALEGLKNADIILYDALINEDILDFAAPTTPRIFVGKRAGIRSKKQSEITNLMITHAKNGKRVLRLKGGDPFIFGRGGEEAIELARSSIHFRIIPGITAGIGGIAYAGIPATHRDINTVISFITGHDSSGELPHTIDWDSLAKSSPVMVFYMALKTMPEIIRNLTAAGLNPQTSLAIISSATTPKQTTLETTLENYQKTTQPPRPKSPAIIIIGESVKIRGLIKDFQQTISNDLKTKALEGQ